MKRLSNEAKFTFDGNGPMKIEIGPELEPSALDDSSKLAAEGLAETIHAYLTACRELLKERYALVKDLVPEYLSNPGKVLILICADGLLIRYDAKVDKTADKTQLAVAFSSDSLITLAPQVSQNVIYCYSDRDFKSTVSETGMELTFFSQDPQTQHTQTFFAAKIGFDTVLERPDHLPSAPQKPYCLLSVRNEIEIGLLGELTNNIGKATDFLIRSKIRLPVGWECIEIFPFLDLEQWKPEYGPIWAEADLLAAVTARQFQEIYYLSLDPRAGARRELGKLLKSYKELLDSNPEKEEILQSFLRDNAALLCPAHVSIRPKLPLGARVTDFVFREPTGDYILVELEKSTYRLFLKDGHPSSELTHAQGQVLDWKRYLEDNLSTVQRELDLPGISANPKLDFERQAA